MITCQQLQNLYVEALIESPSVTHKFKTKMSSTKVCVYMYAYVCVCARAHVCVYVYACSKNIFYWNPINSEVINRRCKILRSWNSPSAFN